MLKSALCRGGRNVWRSQRLSFFLPTSVADDNRASVNNSARPHPVGILALRLRRCYLPALHPSKLILAPPSAASISSSPPPHPPLLRRKGKPKKVSGDETLPAGDLPPALHEAISQLTKKYGGHSVSFHGHNTAPSHVDVISSGSLGLDLALGVGGLPKGRITEIYGFEASGKTTLALHCIAEAQKLGGRCALVDVEQTLDHSLAQSCGVNMRELILYKPNGGEEALHVVDLLIRSGEISVLVLDSVAALVPQSELEGEMGDPHMATQARLMGQALRKVNPAVQKSGTILIFINQVTSGGMALRFFASVRLNIRRLSAIKSGDQVIGNRVRVKVVKNKVAGPYKETEFDIDVGHGISREAELIDFGLKYDIVTKVGNWHAYKGENFANGREKAKAHLRENKALADEMYTELRTLMFSKTKNESVAPNEDEETEDNELELNRE